MQLTVRPADLRDAAARILGCAERLDGELAGFRVAVERDLPAVGPEALEATGEAGRAAIAAGQVLVDDLRTLASALRVLAASYAEFDRELVAVPRADPG